MTKPAHPQILSGRKARNARRLEPFRILRPSIDIGAGHGGPPPWNTAPATRLYAPASHLIFGFTAELTRRQVRTTLLPSG